MATTNTYKAGTSLRKPLRWLLAIVLCAGIVAGYFGYCAICDGLKEQGVSSIRSTILNAAEQCYAIEGAYPASLDYLKDHYAVCVNEKDYTITYVVFASNIQPTVMVVAK